MKLRILIFQEYMSSNRILTILICLCLLWTLTRCKSMQRTRSLKADYKSTYIAQFKLTYFQQLLKKGYNNSPAIQEILGSDHSGFTEQILNENDYLLIDSLTTADNHAMKLDSAQGEQRAEGAQGKRPLGYIVELFNSKQLDSLARQRLKLSGIKTWTY